MSRRASNAELWSIINDAMGDSDSAAAGKSHVEIRNASLFTAQTTPVRIAYPNREQAASTPDLKFVKDTPGFFTNRKTSSGNLQYWRRRISSMYKQYNPAKLQDKTFVDSVLKLVSSHLPFEFFVCSVIFLFEAVHYLYAVCGQRGAGNGATNKKVWS